MKPPAAKPSRLGLAKREQLQVPLFYLWYGPEGIGKTSLLADMPSPIVLDIEGGSARLEIARYQFRDSEGGHVASSYDEILAAVDDLVANPGHGFRTVGIDTADALEAMLHAYICRRDGEKNIEGYGFAKGYKVALAELRVLIHRLNVLRYRDGMNVAFLAHAKAKTFKNPEGPDYDRWSIVGDDLFTAELRARCDVVGFLHAESGGAKLPGEEKSKTARARGYDTGRRLIELSRTAAWDAKTRLAVPAQIELAREHPFSPFSDAKVVSEAVSSDALAADIAAEIARITGADGDIDFTTAAGSKTSRSAIAKIVATGDTNVMSRVLSGLRATEPTATTQTQDQE
ncbi:MAG TPA: ATP-binding protein [Mycobacterium sp.]|nr:ATP-binding protein [Mycobacterium sp.]